MKTQLQRDAAEAVGSWLNPFNYGFMTWLIVGVVAFFGFSMLSDTKGGSGGGFLGKLFDMLPEGAQKWIAGKSSGIDGGAAIALRDIAKRHGSNGLTTNDFLKPEILFDAMLEQPTALLNIARGLNKGGEMDATSRQAMTAVRQLVNDPAKMATLLNDKNKANTFALLEAMTPIPFKAGALGTFVGATAMRGGKVDPAFIQLLNSALTEGDLDERLKPAEVSAFFSRPGNAKAFGALLNSVDDAKLTPQMRKAIGALRANWGTSSEGLAEVMADEDSIRWLVELSNKPETVTSKAVGMVPDAIKTAIGGTLPSHMTKLPEKVGENLGQLLAVQGAFKEAGVVLDGSAAAAPKRAGGNPVIAH